MPTQSRNSHPEVFQRLEQAFGCWEEEMWKLQTKQRLSLFSGEKPDIAETGYPVDEFEDTRSMLLQAATAPSHDYLLPDFRSQGIQEKPKLSSEQIALEIAGGRASPEFNASVRWYEYHFPYYLGKWNAHSRRIYHLPQDLVLMLQATSLRGHTYRDLRYPMSSFGLALETPIVSDVGQELDFLLLCGEQNPEALYGFSNKLRSWKPTDLSLRSKINKAFRSSNQARFKSLIRKPLLKSNRFADLWMSSSWLDHNDSSLDIDIEDDFESASRLETRDKSMDWTDKLFRVVLGFAFYLQAFEDSHKGLVRRIPAEELPRPDSPHPGESIASPEDIFKVQSIFELSAEEREGLTNFFAGKGGWEVNTHFREGHWRRPPGEGHNPSTPKTVWVRPTMVRRDRLAEGTLPMGRGVNIC